jgi:hypothetical protein
MYKTTSKRQSYLKRLASHATKPRANGLIEIVPENAERVVKKSELGILHDTLVELSGRETGFRGRRGKLAKKLKREQYLIKTSLRIAALQTSHASRAPHYEETVELVQLELSKPKPDKQLLRKLRTHSEIRFPDFPELIFNLDEDPPTMTIGPIRKKFRS